MKRDVIKYHISTICKDYMNKICKFKCGNDEMDKYLKDKALSDLDSGDGTTKVVINDNNDEVIAYYTLNCSAIVVNSHKKKYYSPAIEIKMFALSEKYHKYQIDEDENYISDLILCNIISEINDFTRQTCGAKSIILYSVDDAKHFYSRNSFECFEPYMEQNNDRYLEGCTPMFFTL